MGHYSEAVLTEFSDIHGGGKKEETPSNIGNGNESRHDREDSREKEQEEKVQCRRGVGGSCMWAVIQARRMLGTVPSKRRVVLVVRWGSSN